MDRFICFSKPRVNRIFHQLNPDPSPGPKHNPRTSYYIAARFEGLALRQSTIERPEAARSVRDVKQRELALNEKKYHNYLEKWPLSNSTSSQTKLKLVQQVVLEKSKPIRDLPQESSLSTPPQLSDTDTFRWPDSLVSSQ